MKERLWTYGDFSLPLPHPKGLFIYGGGDEPPRHVPLAREDHGGIGQEGEIITEGSFDQRPVIAENEAKATQKALRICHFYNAAATTLTKVSK